MYANALAITVIVYSASFARRESPGRRHLLLQLLPLVLASIRSSRR
jgi:hypothetical protein